jgi:type IV pilus assembly protein PilW
MSMHTRSNSIRFAGFTLIEVLIAMLIGMIGLVVMMQTFAVSEGFKRTATNGTDAQINGGVALYMLQRELRLSGAGLNNFMSMGCTSVRVWNNATSTGVDINMFPFEINTAGVPAGDANTDTITIAYGTAPSFVAGIPLSGPQAGSPTVPFALLSNSDTFETGDLFISVVPGAGVGGNPSCVLHEATATDSASGNCGYNPTTAGTVEHKTTAYQQHTPTGCVATTPRFNSATGIKDSTGAVVPLATAQSPSSLIFDMGKPSVKVYAIRGGNLTMCDWIATDCTVAANYSTIVNDIVSLRAVYGMNLTPSVSALPGDYITTTWQRASLTTNVFLPSRVTAVALELTARSTLKEKRSDGTACVGGTPALTDVTPTATSPDRSQNWLYQSMAGAGIDLSAVSADWNCYRYRLFQTRVPLRNVIWRP